MHQELGVGYDTQTMASPVPSGFPLLLAHWFGTDEFMRVLYVQPSVKTPYSLHTVLTSLRPILWPTLLYLILISISVFICHSRVRYRAGSSSITGPMRLQNGAGRAMPTGHLTTKHDASRADHKTHDFYSVQLWHIVEILALCRAVSYLRAVYNIKRGLRRIRA